MSVECVFVVDEMEIFLLWSVLSKVDFVDYNSLRILDCGQSNV